MRFFVFSHTRAVYASVFPNRGDHLNTLTRHTYPLLAVGFVCRREGWGCVAFFRR